MTFDPGPPHTCQGCGVCCEEQGMPPGYAIAALLTFLPRELRGELARHQREERRAGHTRHERGLPCIWHDAETGLCRHYEHRPPLCRELPIGGHSCLFWRERRRASLQVRLDAERRSTPGREG
jgi:Fe-S-cluster containining protein